MTRILKMSLSLVVLLLVVAMVLTGCNTDELDASIADANAAAAQAQKDALAAQEAAEKNLAEANKKLAEAIAQLNDAMKNKADGADLTAQIEALQNAIDGLKNAEMDPEVKAKLDQLAKDIEDVKANMNPDEADKEVVMLSNLFLLNARFEALEENEVLYEAEKWAAIEKAYETAYVKMTRATIDTDLAAISAEFEEAVLANANDVDTFYNKLAALKADATLADVIALVDEVEALWAKAENQETRRALIQSYYPTYREAGEGKNLYLRAMDAYTGVLDVKLVEIKNRHLVYTNDAVFTTDAADVGTPAVADPAAAATGAYLDLDNYNTAKTAFETAIPAAADADKNLTVTKADLDVAKARIDLLNTTEWTNATLSNPVGAAAAAEAIENWAATNVTGAGITVEALGAKTADEALKAEIVNPLNQWNALIVAWTQRYLIPVEGEYDYFNATSETILTATVDQQRYYANYALIQETTKDLKALVDIIAEYTDTYKADAAAYQIAISKFYKNEFVVTAEDLSNPADLAKIKNGVIDYTKISLLSKADLNAIADLYEAFIVKYAVNLDLTYNPSTEKTVDQSREEEMLINAAFDAKTAAARTTWDTVSAKYTAIAVEGYADTLKIYNEDVYTVFDWFKEYGAYAAADVNFEAATGVGADLGAALQYTTSKLNGEDVACYDLREDGDITATYVITKEMYDDVVAVLTDALATKIKAQADIAKNINDAVAALCETTADGKFVNLNYTDAVDTDGYLAKVVASYNAYLAGEETIAFGTYTLPQGVTNDYESAKTTLNTDRKFALNAENFTKLMGTNGDATTDSYVKTLKDLYTAMSDAYTALNTKQADVKPTPDYFGNDSSKFTAYQTATTALKDARDAFLAKNAANDVVALTADAAELIADSELVILLEETYLSFKGWEAKAVNAASGNAEAQDALYQLTASYVARLIDNSSLASEAQWKENIKNEYNRILADYDITAITDWTIA